MQLPGRLDASTLGDILGVLYRGSATGVLELCELGRGATAQGGRIHRIHLLSGLVASVETELKVAPIGELLAQSGKLDRRAIDVMLYRMAIGDPRPAGAILIGLGAISSETLVAGLRGQLQAKINAVFAAVNEARVSFRTSRPLPKEALRIGTLMPRDFLQGRPRKRDRKKAHAENVHAGRATESTGTPYKTGWSKGPIGYEGQSHQTPPPPSGPRKTNAADPRQSGSSNVPQSSFSSPRVTALRTLGLSMDADEVTIRRAFKRLAMELHPDRYATSPEEIQSRNQALFAEASAAYHVLVA